MNVITSGRINISPFASGHETDLPRVLQVMLEDEYDRVPGTGWGGLTPRMDEADTPAVLRTNPGVPRIVEMSGSPVLLARRLVDRYSRASARQFDDEMLESLPPEYTHRLEATDVLIMGGGEARVLVASHDPLRCVEVLGVVGHVLADALDDTREPTDLTQWLVGDSDFFLWLIYRFFSDTHLSDEMELLDLRYVRGQNHAGQRVDIRDSAGADRAEFHALIAQPAAQFGTCKFQLFHRGLDLEVDMQLNVDGTFSPFVQTSWYRDQIEAPPDWTVQLTMDVTNTVIPDLYSAHAADRDWSGHRRSFRTDSRAATAALLA